MANDLIPTFEARLSRHTLIRGAGLAASGLAAAALIGCGGDEADEPSAGEGAGGAATTSLKTTDPRPDTLPPGWQWAEGAPFPADFPEPDKPAKPGGIFTVATSWDVGPFDPAVAAAGGSITVPNAVYNRIVGFKIGPGVDKDSLDLEPELAASWERTPDGLVWTFKVQQGVKWHNVPPLNGRDFVAADLKFAYERYKNEGVYKTYWVNVTSIEAPDPATLKVRLSKPVVDFLYPLAGRYQTVFPRELVEDGSIKTAIVGTGPLILREAVTGQHVKLDKNPDSFERDILLDGVEFRPMPDASARLAAFRSGQVDFSYSPVTTRRDVDAVIQSNPDVQVTLLRGSNASGPTPMLNQQNPKWQDVRVRRALSLAIDRNAISQLLFEGFGRTMSVLPWFYVHDELPTIESGKLGNWARHNPEEAKQLLQAAGRDNMTVDAPYFEYSTAHTQIAEINTDQLRQVGINYQPKKLDYTEFNSQLIGGTFPDALAGSYLPLGFEADTYYYNGVHSKSPGNRDHMSDPDIDKWSEAQQVELDPEARKALLARIWERYHDGAYRPLAVIGPSYNIFQPWVRGLRLGGALGVGSFFYDWGELIQTAWLAK
jgi:peptide/nickel transport system substrate-binding protein